MEHKYLVESYGARLTFEQEEDLINNKYPSMECLNFE